MKEMILLILIIIIYVLFGSAITILVKYLYHEKSKDKYFSHDAFITLLSFFAEMFSLLLYLILYLKSKKNKKEQEPQEEIDDNVENISNIKKILITFIPSSCDIIATFLCNIFLDFIDGSIFTMIRGVSIIIITFLISKFIMKNKHTWDHLIAIIIAIISFIFVGLSVFSKEESWEENIIEWVGVIIAMLFQSIQLSLEEYFIRKYQINQFFFLGFEGVFGFIFNLILCIILYWVKCGDEPSEYEKAICAEDGDGVWRYENIIFAFEQIYDNILILICIIILIFAIAGFNILGISIIKYGGAITRSLIENFRSFIVWLYFLFPFIKDDLKENFDWFRLAGLICITISVIVYFGVFKIDERIAIRKKISQITSKEEEERTDTDTEDTPFTGSSINQEI